MSITQRTGIDEQLLSAWQSQSALIEAWFAEQESQLKRLPYGSVDLRFSGDKRVPVDTNLFPAGFNNLDPAAQVRAAASFLRHLRHCCPKSRKVLIVPENHTRNQGYLDNLVRLETLLMQAGYKVVIGRLDLVKGEHFDFASSAGVTAKAVALYREGSRLLAGEDAYDADVILLNNDLTSGTPPLLEGLQQPITPPLSLGWHRRRKSEHFASYQRISRQFADAFGVDAWRISAEFEQCGRINFAERNGLECVALNVEKLLHRLREHYAAHGITRDPYVFIKADSGTYGMGIMTVRSGDDVMQMNKKTRNKMDVIKEGAHSTDVIIQEGIPTLDEVDGAFAEPVIYLVDHQAVGAVWRVNAERSDENNLNATGMRFSALAGDIPIPMALIARLAMLAAAAEDYET
ncbi:MAG: glutamate--cysteine ligase [Rickettsiales bacterium]|nr:glutamate--cysteine ligase [Rickettsiales bacterium]